MAKTLMMPKMGFDMEQGKIVRWLKQEGDAVERGEKVAEIETEKVTIEVENFDDGILHTIVAQAGEEVPVGEPIAVVAQPGEDVDLAALNITVSAAPATEPAAAEAAASNGAAVEAPAPDAAPAGRVRASPLARRLAAEYSLDLASITGSGPLGRIERRDVEAARAAPPAAAPPPAAPAPLPAPAVAAATGPEYEDIEPNRMRAAIARAMTMSKPGAPHFYVTVPIDMGATMALRKQLVALAPDESAQPSLNDMVIAGVARTLRNVPDLNAWFIDGKVRRFRRVHVGVAVSLDDGLVVPVVHDTDTKSVYQLAAETKALIERTRGGRNRPDDFEGSTFTISNMGALTRDVEEFSAIINPPQAAILAVAASIRQPVVRDDQIVIADIMRVTLSVDHRVGDGAKAVTFLAELKRIMENPLLLLDLDLARPPA
ncbi:MAG: dihydrolipoamide acetyltransferase family protein [Chloroflexota bacterium]|nr:dihydrolipoamide acetyltransferase family protein [Chloroflexota bacterium]